MTTFITLILTCPVKSVPDDPELQQRDIWLRMYPVISAPLLRSVAERWGFFPTVLFTVTERWGHPFATVSQRFSRKAGLRLTMTDEVSREPDLSCAAALVVLRLAVSL